VIVPPVSPGPRTNPDQQPPTGTPEPAPGEDQSDSMQAQETATVQEAEHAVAEVLGGFQQAVSQMTPEVTAGISHLLEAQLGNQGTAPDAMASQAADERAPVVIPTIDSPPTETPETPAPPPEAPAEAPGQPAEAPTESPTPAPEPAPTIPERPTWPMSPEIGKRLREQALPPEIQVPEGPSIDFVHDEGLPKPEPEVPAAPPSEPNPNRWTWGPGGGGTTIGPTGPAIVPPVSPGPRTNPDQQPPPSTPEPVTEPATGGGLGDFILAHESAEMAAQASEPQLLPSLGRELGELVARLEPPNAEQGQRLDDHLWEQLNQIVVNQPPVPQEQQPPAQRLDDHLWEQVNQIVVEQAPLGQAQQVHPQTEHLGGAAPLEQRMAANAGQDATSGPAVMLMDAPAADAVAPTVQAAAAVETTQTSALQAPEHWSKERAQDTLGFIDTLREHGEKGGSFDRATLEELSGRKEEALESLIQDATDVLSPPPPDEEGAQPRKHILEVLGYERPQVTVTTESIEASQQIIDHRLSDLPPEQQTALSARVDEILERVQQETDPHRAYLTMRQAARLVNNALGYQPNTPEFLEVSHDEEASRHGLTYAQTLRERVRLGDELKGQIGEMDQAADRREVTGLFKDSKVQTQVERSQPPLSEVNLTIIPVSMHRGAEHPSIHGIEAAELSAMTDLLTSKNLARPEELEGLKHDQLYEKYCQLYRPDDLMRQNGDLYDLVRKRYSP
jgi:hypothetical protein